MTNNGWVKFHKRFLKWEWYDCLPVKTAFFHCILMANWEDKTYRGKTVKRGQFLTGISQFAQQTGLSYQQVRTAWKKLEATGEITTQRTNKGTCITVCNYSTYQKVPEDYNKQDNKPANNQITNNQQTNNNQITTTKKYKNNKKYKKGKKYSINSGGEKWDQNQPVDYASFVEAFNELYEQNLRTTSRKREHIRGRLRTFTAAEIVEAWGNRLQDDFLTGEGQKYLGSWKAAMRNDEKIERYLTENIPDYEPTDKAVKNTLDVIQKVDWED